MNRKSSGFPRPTCAPQRQLDAVCCTIVFVLILNLILVVSTVAAVGAVFVCYRYIQRRWKAAHSAGPSAAEETVADRPKSPPEPTRTW